MFFWISLWAEGSHLGILTGDHHNELEIEHIIDLHMEVLGSSQKHRLKIYEKDQEVKKGWKIAL